MVVAATGFFDGVHLGHKEVVERMHSIAVSECGTSVAVTFWPHPRTVLGGCAPVGLLSTLEEKTALLKSYGADKVEIIPFNREVSGMTTSRFVCETLRDRIGVDTLIVGYNHRLGHDVFDSVESMMEVIRECGVTPVKVNEFVCNAYSVSSTRIRESLLCGDVDSAALLLGYRYRISGYLAYENGVVCLVPDSFEKLIPADGWYKVALNGILAECTIQDGIVLFPAVAGSQGMAQNKVCVEF